MGDFGDERRVAAAYSPAAALSLDAVLQSVLLPLLLLLFTEWPSREVIL